MKLRRAFMWAMIVSLSVCGVAGIVVLLFPRIPYEEEVLATAATVGLYSLLAMVNAIVIERARRTIYTVASSIAIALALLAMALVVIEIWDSRWPGDLRMKSVVAATFLAIDAAHLGLYAPARITGPGRWAKIGAVGGVSAFCLLMAILIWFEPEEDFFLRLLGVMGIIGVMGSAITPIAWKMQSLHRREHATPSMRGEIRVHVRCPRCDAEQDVPVGHAKCARCRLDIRIEIEEPRCVCGYPFLGLRADTCPECGQPIPEADRWATAEPLPTTDDAPPAR